MYTPGEIDTWYHNKTQGSLKVTKSRLQVIRDFTDPQRKESHVSVGALTPGETSFDFPSKYLILKPSYRPKKGFL